MSARSPRSTRATDNPSSRALTAARLSATVSFDPNIRPLVTPDRDAVEASRRAASLARTSRQGERGRPRVALSRPRASRTASPPGRSPARDFASRRSASAAPSPCSASERIEVPAPPRRGRRHRRRRRQLHVGAAVGDGPRPGARRQGARAVPKRTREVAPLCGGRFGDHLHAQGLRSADAHGSRGGARRMIGNALPTSLSKAVKPIVVADVSRAV